VSYGKATAYLPVCDRFKAYCHIEDRDDLRTVRAKVTGQALLAARIDRLPLEDKRLLQTAAVIGTEVPWPLLQTIADTSDEVLYRSLAQLQAAEFLYETSLFPERAYTFKHALTHEVAYGRQAGDKALTRSAYREAVVCAAIDLYRDMAMTFWLPQAEAALAQAVG
jgi:hypothetical protein